MPPRPRRHATDRVHRHTLTPTIQTLRWVVPQISRAGATPHSNFGRILPNVCARPYMDIHRSRTTLLGSKGSWWAGLPTRLAEFAPSQGPLLVAMPSINLQAANRCAQGPSVWTLHLIPCGVPVSWSKSEPRAALPWGPHVNAAPGSDLDEVSCVWHTIVRSKP